MEPKETTGAGPAPLTTGRMLVYSLPSGAQGFMMMLVGIYFLKFSTDVLLIAPATMGLLFGLSRLWDAFSDPLCGYWTDRTRTRWGRRRPWMVAGAIPMAAAFLLMWSPPSSLEGAALGVWMGATMLVFYTGFTMLDVPHAALGAELTDAYHERTRLFGVRRIVFGLGSLGAVAAMAAFDLAASARAVGTVVGLAACGIALPATLFMVARTRERPEFQGRGARQPWHALRDVWRNPHARLLLAVFMIQQLGVTALMVCMPFYSEYVLGTPDKTFVYIGAMLGSSVLGVPIWMRLAPRFEKKTATIASMAVIGVVISFLAIAPQDAFWLVIGVAVVGGLAAAGTDVLFPSIQADVIDWDELQSGQRKEGAYFAAWAFAAKTAGALASMLVGLALSGMGFVANGTQDESVLIGLRVLAGVGPCAVYALGIFLFLRFSMSRAEHARILEQLGRPSLEPAQSPSSTDDESFTSMGTRTPIASKRESAV